MQSETTLIFLSVRILRYIFLALLLISFSAQASIESDNERLVDSIRTLMRNYDVKVGHKSAIIDSIKALRQSMSPCEERVKIGERLGRGYLTQNLDSAMMYWQLAMREATELNSPELALRLRMNILALLPLRGVAIEALREFEEIDPSGLSDEMRKHYWLNSSELYYNIQRPYPEGALKNYYRNKAKIALDSLVSYYPYNSPVVGFIGAHILSLNDETNLAVASFIEILPTLKSRPELYDQAIGNIVDFYRNRPEYRAQYVNNLYNRAIGELNAGFIRASVLGELGKVVGEEGYRKLGHELLMLALLKSEDELGPYSYLDHAAYSTILHKGSLRTQYWTVIVIVALALLLVLAIFRLLHRRSREKALRKSLSREASRHEAVVSDMRKISSNLLSMALFSDEQLKEYNLFVHRKLKAGQAKDLFQDVQSGEYVQSLSDKFFAMFDETFFESFPSFVDKLNSLFMPGRELALLPGRRMSPELRIAAFMRLGINDSAKLAQVLGLSINTIYTYRNRLKGRAIDRANFENSLKTIDFGDDPSHSD